MTVAHGGEYRFSTPPHKKYAIITEEPIMIIRVKMVWLTVTVSTFTKSPFNVAQCL